MPLLRQHPDGSQQQVRVEIKLDSFRLKDVCETCNNGWMSKLEEDAKPIILDLIRNQRDLSNLNVEERGILAAWAGKTAVIESRAVGADALSTGITFSKFGDGMAVYRIPSRWLLAVLARADLLTCRSVSSEI